MVFVTSSFFLQAEVVVVASVVEALRVAVVQAHEAEVVAVAHAVAVVALLAEVVGRLAEVGRLAVVVVWALYKPHVLQSSLAFRLS
jgi:hypothetical protein